MGVNYNTAWIISSYETIVTVNFSNKFGFIVFNGGLYM